MVFASLTFLTIFLPLCVGIYYLADRRWQNSVLLAASLLFYVWGSGQHVLLLVLVCAVTYAGGAIVARSSHGRARRLALVTTVVLSLAPLAFFKYAAFFTTVLGDVLAPIGLDITPLPSRDLPIGISFFTFQALSYVIDVSRQDAPTARDFRRYLLYVSLFPQLIAGPIVRYSLIADQVNDRGGGMVLVAAGMQRFLYGLGKKVLIADSVAPLADAVFAADDPSTVAAWLGALAYAVQIYFDFSGYSDMAIGLGLMFGFALPENFNRPYSSVSVTDFWRRWHITLSSWFRDYVFIPLGGSRRTTLITYRNLLIVFFLTALWHGAAWTFLLWGGLHAAALVWERITGRNYLDRTGRSAVISRARTFAFVVVCWVPFRALSIDDAITVWRAMLTPQGLDLDPSAVAAITAKNLVALVVGLAVVAAPREWSGCRTLFGAEELAPVRRTVLTAALSLGCVAALASGTLSPFLYFQF